MTITVTKLKRALEELADLGQDGHKLYSDAAMKACARIASDPTALTILAEKLSERPSLKDLHRHSMP